MLVIVKTWNLKTWIPNWLDNFIIRTPGPFIFFKIESFRDLFIALIPNGNLIMDSLDILSNRIQKQPSIGVLKKRCSENMQQIYRRTLMPKATILKSLFGMGVLLQISCIFSEHLFLVAPLVGCFWESSSGGIVINSCDQCRRILCDSCKLILVII